MISRLEDNGLIGATGLAAHLDLVLVTLSGCSAGNPQKGTSRG
jgi:hypothetical protein